MIARSMLAVCALLLLPFFALAGAPDAALRISTSPAAGLGPQAGVARSGPSDLVRAEGRTYVLYSRTTADAPLYPAPFAGEIWYAVSEDDGHSWSEVGPLLRAGPRGALDAVGVFGPNALRWLDGDWYLFYSGVGPGFNFRLERDARTEPVRLFVARLSADPATGRLSAERLAGGAPILEPSPRATRAFDSLRVDGATPLIRNGHCVLLYRGLEFGNEGAGSRLGVAYAEAPEGPYQRLHDGRTVLPFSGDALVGLHGGGLFALLTGSDRGLWWAQDGEHFARLDVRVNGFLDDPGLFRGDADGRLDPGEVRWGLHVGGRLPEPWLERFELVLGGELPQPRAATVPTPSPAAFETWTRAGWLAQHQEMLEAASRQPVDYVFLGDGLIEGFGGHQRVADAPGEAVWRESFQARRVRNLGVAGDHTEHVLWRLDHGALEGVEARAIVLEVGSEQLAGSTPQEVVAGVEAIVQRLRVEHPGADVVVASLPRRPFDDEQQLKRIARCNEGLARVARRARVRFVDLNPVLAGSSGRVELEYFDSRGDRLSPAGYARWSQALAPVLAEIDRLALESAHLKLEELRGEEADRE